VAASGEAPLDYMLQIMRDKNAPAARRDEMAKAAAPYVHPRLAAVTQKVDAQIQRGSVEILEELEREIARHRAKAAT
jgi:hypothetical protein